LPKAKLLQSLLRIYIVFNEPNPWIGAHEFFSMCFNSWYFETDSSPLLFLSGRDRAP
jgi:hypothetical protein